MWECRVHTYRGLLLPHLDVLPLCLSEVIPDLLVAGRSKDSFDLTDCWWHGRMLHTKTQQILRCIPLLELKLYAPSFVYAFFILFSRHIRVTRISLFLFFFLLSTRFELLWITTDPRAPREHTRRSSSLISHVLLPVFTNPGRVSCVPAIYSYE